MNWKKSIILSVFLLSIVGHTATENIKFVVSAGVLADQDPFNAFYLSRVFRSDEVAPFSVVNAMGTAFENDSSLFFAERPFKPKLLLDEGKLESRVVADGFIGHSYRGVALAGTTHEDVRRYLGAETIQFTVEKKRIQEQEIWGVSKIAGKNVSWPKTVDELKALPAVVLQKRADDNARYVVVARRVGATAHAIGIVDNLKKEGAGWIDVGSNSDVQSASNDYAKPIRERAPLKLFAGTAELSTLRTNKDAFKDLSLGYPYGDFAHSKSMLNGNEVNWWTASGTETMWPHFDMLGKRRQTHDIINQMSKASLDPNRKLNVVRAYSEAAAEILARSVYVDLVLLPSNDLYAQLPKKEIFELAHAQTDGSEQVAPIIRVSKYVVSSIKLYGETPFTVSRAEVERFAITDDAPSAQDIALNHAPTNDIALPKRTANVYGKQELEKIVGGILLEDTKANIAIFPQLAQTTPITSVVSLDVAKSLMSSRGNLVQMTISGLQIKRIAGFIAQNQLPRKHVIYGLDSHLKKIGKRTFADNERFDVVISEESLLEIFGLSRLGSFPEFSSDRAMFIAAVYADPRQLFYVSGQKSVPISDTANEIQRAVDSITVGRRFDDVIAKGLAHLDVAKIERYIDDAKGVPHHVITLDIAYLDVGISKNVVNDNYRDASAGFPTSRGTIKPYAHLFLYTKIALNHQAPLVYTTLFNETKYMHTNLNEKPEKDKTRLGLKFRLPWENSYFEGKSVVISPVFTSVYETKLAPHIWANNDELRKRPRTKRIDSLLGFNFNFTKLGFDTDVGGVMATDFNRTNTRDALDFGPGVNFNGKWRLFGPLELNSDFQSVYLFPLPQSARLNKIAFGLEGTVWLRFARFYDFSVAASSDIMAATLQNAPTNWVLSSIFGLTVSYGRLFRLLG